MQVVGFRPLAHSPTPCHSPTLAPPLSRPPTPPPPPAPPPTPRWAAPPLIWGPSPVPPPEGPAAECPCEFPSPITPSPCFTRGLSRDSPMPLLHPRGPSACWPLPPPPGGAPGNPELLPWSSMSITLAADAISWLSKISRATLHEKEAWGGRAWQWHGEGQGGRGLYLHQGS